MFSGIENYYETLVFDRIRKLTKERGEEPDPDYWEDLACVALNHLPPHYVRHIVDFISHLSDEQRDNLNSEVNSAVDYALTLTRDSRHIRGN